MSPIGRPIASSQATRNPLTDGRSGEIRPTNHVHIARPSRRISTSVLDHLASQLTDQDRDVLGHVARSRMCTGEQLQRLFWPEGTKASRERQARRALRRLADWRILDRLPRSVGGVRAGSRGLIFCLGPAGARLLQREATRTRLLEAPGARFIDHTLAISELVVRLREAERAGRLDVLEVQNEPACWRAFPGSLGARLHLKADLFVRIGVGSLEDRWFVEVDRGTEAASTVTGKGRQYLAHYRSGIEQSRHGVYPRVVWSVPDQRRAQVVTGALAELPAQFSKLFLVTRHDSIIDRLAAEAAS
jgi:hypothetical protein